MSGGIEQLLHFGTGEIIRYETWEHNLSSILQQCIHS